MIFQIRMKYKALKMTERAFKSRTHAIQLTLTKYITQTNTPASKTQNSVILNKTS